MSRRLFISSGPGGVEFARYLAEWLAQHEIQAWTHEDIDVGDDVAERIRLELSRATHAVIVLTDTPPSPWLHFEWSELQERRSMDPRVQLIPVQLGHRRLPPFLRDTDVIEVPEGRDEWERSMTRIGELLEGARPPRDKDTTGLSKRLAQDLQTAAEQSGESEALQFELAAAERALDEGHTTGDGQRLAELLGRVGVLKLHLEHPEEAVEPLEIAQRLLTEGSDVDPGARVSTAYCLGVALSRVGRVDEAATLLRRAAMESAQTDVDDFTTAAIAFRAGLAVEDAGDSEFAQTLFGYARSLTEPLLGTDHPTVTAYRQASRRQA